MDVRNNTTAGDGRLDQRVQLFVTSDGQLQVTGCDTLHLEILRGVSSQLEHLSGQVLEDSGRIDGGSRSDTAMSGRPRLQMSVDTTDRELKTGTGGSRDRLRLRLSRVLSCLASGLQEAVKLAMLVFYLGIMRLIYKLYIKLQR